MQKKSILFLYALAVLFIFFLTACNSTITETGSNFGIGNTVVFIFVSAILTAIAYVVGVIILGEIPYVGIFFEKLTKIAIAVWWIVLIWGCIVNYGWLSFIIAVIVIIVISIFFPGGPGGIIIFFK